MHLHDAGFINTVAEVYLQKAKDMVINGCNPSVYEYSKSWTVGNRVGGSDGTGHCLKFIYLIQIFWIFYYLFF